MNPALQKIFFALLLVVIIQVKTISQTEESTSLKFIENKGQWAEDIDFLLKGNAGDIFFEGNTITYNLYDKSIVYDMHHGRLGEREPIIKGHVYKTHLLNSLDASISSSKSSAYSINYFVGNDPSKWATNIRAKEEIQYHNIYDNIDMKFYGFYGQLKYDFIVEPGGNPNDIILQYDGVNNLKISNGHLIVETSLGNVIEQSPYAYQIIKNNKKEVVCNYQVLNDQVIFSFPEGFDQSTQLIIDPVLTFGTYTGSTSDNFGCTASYDEAGNMYVGGTSFGMGYPTTVGAYQTTHNGGNIDMAISKFSSDGTTMIYSTYIGGIDNEIPHSLVVNSNNELCILGTTGSNNYPAINGYDITFNGGPSLNFGQGYGFNYLNGCDIVVTKLSAAGNSILGSTFVGGTGNDGINKGSILHYNYGDAFRGEIIVDENDHIYVASTTSSLDFPVTSTNVQGSFAGGGLDACLFKLSPSVSSLEWATYLGGNNYDCAYSVQLGSNGDIYTTGGTLSLDFPTTPGVIHPSYLGGITDGFLAHIDASGNTLTACSYIGTNGYDQCYFVQTDPNDDVFVVGQTDGTYPIIGSVYSNPNSGQFIHKLSNDLSSTLMSTTFGTGSGNVDIAISAFLVSDCGPIYVSGWGGPLDGIAFVDAHAVHSTTIGLPIAGDPFQAQTDGEDFYLIVLGEDASTLNYATYFGGANTEEHVDGGTSRFDKHGKVYQAVCAGCGGHSDFPTTPGAWSNTNNSPNCNLGAFKFDLAFVTPVITTTDPYACIPGSYTFLNNSQGANSFLWDFGDGTNSTDFSPTHVYLDSGTYDVLLIGEDTTGCLAPDTAFLSLNVYEAGVATISSSQDTICPNDTTILSATGGGNYSWTPADYLIFPDSSSPIAFPPVTTTYQVVIDNLCLDDTLEITVYVYNYSTTIINDTSICVGDSVSLGASGGISYSWYPQINILNSTTAFPTVWPSQSATYYVDITTSDGCIITDSVRINVDQTLPVSIISNDTIICLGDSVEIFASGAPFIHWTPTQFISNPDDSSTFINPSNSTMFYAELTNSCGSTFDSVYITTKIIDLSLLDNTTICLGDSIQLTNTGGGTTFSWSPSNSLVNPTVEEPIAFPSTETTYTIITNDLCGSDTSSVTISLFNETTDIIDNFTACFGVSVPLWATGGIAYNWYPTSNLINQNTANPEFLPTGNTWIYVDITTINGCTYTDSVKIEVVFTTPQPTLTGNTTICQGDAITLTASGGTIYNWDPDYFSSTTSGSSVTISPNITTTISVEYINVCGSSYDSVTITVIPVTLNTVNDTLICPGDTAILWANGMDFYEWSPAQFLSTTSGNTTFAFPSTPTIFSVIGNDSTGCSRTNEISVDLYDLPEVDAGEDIYIDFGDATQLDGFAYNNYFWSGTDSLSCTTCLNPRVQPFQTTQFILFTTDIHGCQNSDTVLIRLDGVLYIPNSFTPNGDGINDYFDIQGLDIKTYKLYIFNRWGELLFESDNLLNRWDGRYKGNLVLIDTYVWKVQYSDYLDNSHEKIGHVNVLR